MWRQRMIQHPLVTSRLTMIFQHRSKARKPRLNRSMSLKGAKACSGAVGEGVVLYFELMSLAIKRDGDDVIVIIRASGV